jgi:FAD dependent oxidoreductase
MRSLAETQSSVFWLDDPAAPPALPSLVGAVDADLVVVCGGYTGLWTALQAKEADPGRDVVLVEAATVGWAASGRNGGFGAISLTHGEANGLDRFPDEFDTLERLGQQQGRTSPIQGTISWADQFLGHVFAAGTSLGQRVAKTVDPDSQSVLTGTTSHQHYRPPHQAAGARSSHRPQTKGQGFTKCSPTAGSDNSMPKDCYCSPIRDVALVVVH